MRRNNLNTIHQTILKVRVGAFKTRCFKTRFKTCFKTPVFFYKKKHVLKHSIDTCIIIMYCFFACWFFLLCLEFVTFFGVWFQYTMISVCPSISPHPSTPPSLYLSQRLFLEGFYRYFIIKLATYFLNFFK